MPTLPWNAISRVDASRDYLVMATLFTVSNRFRFPAVLAATRELWQSLPTSSGLVGYSLQATPIRGTLGTLSAWLDRGALDQFVHGATHQDLVSVTAPWLRESTFEGWRSTGSELPPRWATARERLARPRPNTEDPERSRPSAMGP